MVASKDWTSGFFPGELWYMYEYTKDDYWKSKAQEFTANIEDQKTNGGTHDMGFKMYCSFGKERTPLYGAYPYGIAPWSSTI